MRKKVLRISCLIVLCLFIILLLRILPLLRLRSVVKELMDETYIYTMNCSVSGFETIIFNGELKGNFEGSKGNEVLYGKFTVEKKELVELYVDEGYEIILSVTPLWNDIMDWAEEREKIPKSVLKLLPKEINVSMDQMEEIIGKDIITISDAGITSELFESIVGYNKGKVSYRIRRQKNLDDEFKVLGENALYYSVTLKDSHGELLIGVPENKKDKKIALIIFCGDIVWKFEGEYVLDAVKEVHMPADALPDLVVNILKNVVEEWKRRE